MLYFQPSKLLFVQESVDPLNLEPNHFDCDLLKFQHFTGQTNGGIPEPESKLPEGKIPTHVQAIMDHKAKMKAEGKEYPEDSD